MVVWCGDPATSGGHVRQDGVEPAVGVYCERHAREHERWESLRPPVNRERSEKVSLRGVVATIVVWGRDSEGPRLVGRAVRDPGMLGAVVEALAHPSHMVAELLLSAGRVAVKVHVREAWLAEDIEWHQHRLQDAAELACELYLKDREAGPDPNPGLGGS